MITRRLILPAAALFAATISVSAQAVAPSTPTPAPAPVSEKSAIPTASEVVIKDTDASRGIATKGKDSTGRDTLSVDFPEEDVRNILRNVADLFELNIIIPEALQGKASIKLRDVSWRQIFQSVLSPINYTYIEEGNIIKIVSNDSLQVEPVSTEVFIINYARAADLLPTLTTLVDATLGKIVVDSRSNSLVVTERPTRMNRIRPIIEQLDRATDQVMIETKFVEVTDRDVKNIGVNWSSLANYSVGAGPLSGNFNRTRGQTGGGGATGNSGSTGTTTASSGQTGTSNTSGTVGSINGTISSGSTTGSAGGLTNAATTATGTSSAFNMLQSLTNSESTARGISTVFSADEFKLVLSALQSQNSIKLVSNPTIVTLNNTLATILIGQKYPIATPNITPGAGGGAGTITYSITEKDIGIKLEVTPQVNARGFIKLTVKPTVSSISGTVTIPQGAEYPIVSTREATTQISLKDGFTMGIGGLIQDTTTKGEVKVPILGSIPVLGRLFRSDSKNRESSNLIIFITAKTVSAEGAPIEAVFNSDQVRQLDIRRDELPGYRDGSDPFTKPVGPQAAKKSSKK
ncbi:MAG: secretin and TonB N-terminal domain-containing protein [Undibacterium sp.]|nr:secretin and TonB N-terminal domain-containing protein [Opitutaceae bacterium]